MSSISHIEVATKRKEKDAPVLSLLPTNGNEEDGIARGGTKLGREVISRSGEGG